MVLTDFNFAGSDWANPDIRDSRYIECLCECLKERVSHVTSSYGATVNGWKPQSDNKGLFYARSILANFDTVLWDAIPKYYETVITYNTAGGIVYDSGTGIISCPISGAYSGYTVGTEYPIALFTVQTGAALTVDRVMKLAGLDSEDGRLSYGNCYNDTAVIKRWIVSRYKMLKLMTCYGAINKTVYAGVTRNSRLNRLRRAYGIICSWYPEVDPMPAPCYSGNGWYMTARSYNGTNYTNTNCSILTALQDVVESSSDDGTLKLQCSYGGGAPWSYQNLNYIFPGCSGPHSSLPGLNMDTVYSSHYVSDMNIRILNGTDPIPDIPLNLYANDAIGFDGSGQFYADEQLKESTTSGADFTLTFGLDDIPPLPAADDMIYGPCSSNPMGSTKTDKRYLKCGYDNAWNPKIKLAQADINILTPANNATSAWSS